MDVVDLIFILKINYSLCIDWLIDCVMFNILVRYLLLMKILNNDLCSIDLLFGIILLLIILYKCSLLGI